MRRLGLLRRDPEARALRALARTLGIDRTRAVVIFGAGAGMPFFSTDTVAAQRALETRCEVILMGKQGVDGVYDSDPKTNPGAVKFDRLTYDEYLARDLKVADATGIAMARDNKMDMVFFNLSTPGTIGRAVRGEKIGTLVSSSA